MSAANAIPLRAPGVYPYPDAPLMTLTGVRMDVCAFCGVAPRGPARVPVVDEKWPDSVPQVEAGRPINRTQAYAVESFSEYQRLYGGYEGPGLLPYAVASFFEQGGTRAYIARIVHDYGPGDPQNALRVAAGTVPGASTPAGPLVIRARNEGSWGNLLHVQLSYQADPLSFESSAAGQIIFDGSAPITAGEMLRLTLAGGSRVLRVISAIAMQPRSSGIGVLAIAILDTPVFAAIDFAEKVTGLLNADDGAGNTEQLTGLGLSSEHPRWIATVMCNESALLFPDASWSGSDIVPDTPDLEAVAPPEQQFTGGADGWADITSADFFDPNWEITDEVPGQGIQCLAQIEDLMILAVPDLYSPAPLAPVENIIDPLSLAGPDFQTCVDVQSSPPSQGIGSYDLPGLRLDPRDASDLRTITGLQQQVVQFAATVGQFVALLDVPPGISQRRILNWRTAFDSSYAACYHPWLQFSRRDATNSVLVNIPPSAAAAGIIAFSANQFGVPTGPANVLAAEVVGVTDEVRPARHDQLHPLGINVYVRDRDGIRLTAARTLSRNPEYRQLTVRRLITLIKVSLYRQMQWAVFEPNNAALRLEIRLLIENFLRGLFQQGAFAGATEAESFFVRCDETNNPPYLADAGQLVAEIGVAPAEPIEFILVRLSRAGDGTLSIQG